MAHVKEYDKDRDLRSTLTNVIIYLKINAMLGSRGLRIIAGYDDIPDYPYFHKYAKHLDLTDGDLKIFPSNFSETVKRSITLNKR
jgi:hypothetical protein